MISYYCGLETEEYIMYDLIIIGSDPAGLSAAVYGKRAGLNLLVIEEKPMSGGQILNTYEVDNYLGLPGISGFDMGMAFRAHADKLEVAFKEASVTALEDKGEYKLVHADGEVLETRTVIVATGAEHAKLGVPGEEELSGAVHDLVSFFRYHRCGRFDDPVLYEQIFSSRPVSRNDGSVLQQSFHVCFSPH